MPAGVTALNGQALCPRCKIPMDYISETEKMGKEIRITRYYVCPACRRKYVDERIIIERNGDFILVKVTDYAFNGDRAARPVIALQASAPRQAPRRRGALRPLQRR